MTGAPQRAGAAKPGGDSSASVAAADSLPDGAWAAALAGLPAMGPGRLLALLRAWPSRVAWEKVAAGRAHRHPAVARACGRDIDDVVEAWTRASRQLDPAAVWEAHVLAGIGIATLGSPAMPAPLRDDIEPPGVLFHRGRLECIDAPRVGIVGTRTCSGYGREVAFELGHHLTRAGVAVVSGLALGIDGAAHAGAVAALAGVGSPRSAERVAGGGGAGGGGRPVAVVGNGLDVVYPLRNRQLWHKVERHGVLFSESPLGTRPDRWRFPARNRLIAALADVLVVVESHAHGGSMLTVAEAEKRGRTVLAVPGPIRSSSSTGTNRLLADGATPVCDVDDVLMALGLSPAATRAARQQLPPSGRQILDAFEWRPATLDLLCQATGLAPGRVALELIELEQSGHVVARGGWYERVANGG